MQFKEIRNELKLMRVNSIEILGVRVDNLTRAEIENWISNLLDNGQKKFITTLNPEIILKAHQDKNYQNILNSANLNVCDGVGVKLVSFLKGKAIKARFTGADLTRFILKLAQEKNLKVLIVAHEKSLSQPREIKESVKNNYPLLNFSVEYFSNSSSFFENCEVQNAQIIFVNFGAPEQEKFICRNRHRFPQAKILIGVGGTFDFMTGKMKRAPKFLRKPGLEWLWRLIQEPKRFRRIINAVIIFPFLAITK